MYVFLYPAKLNDYANPQRVLFVVSGLSIMRTQESKLHYARRQSSALLTFAVYLGGTR